MVSMLSAKGKDLGSWRATVDFAAAYRDELLERSAFSEAGGALALYSETIAGLERLAAGHEQALQQLAAIRQGLAAVLQPSLMREPVLNYYAILYQQFGQFRSAPLFYNLSMQLLHSLSAALSASVNERLGLFARRMPPWSLVALGPAGRSEFSPYCPLQIMLVHDETGPSERETLSLFSRMLHEGFEELGLRIDPVITPRNPEWRGSLADWRRRFAAGLEQGGVEDLIELLRLTDQHTLCCEAGPADEFRRMSLAGLHASRPAVHNLVERMSALSNGLGLLGKLKLEKSGAERGLFRLLDHGLLPLSAAVSVLSLVKQVDVDGTPQRIRELLLKRELNVDMAERMLHTWHTLHELRLQREQDVAAAAAADEALHIDPEKLDSGRLQELHDALESVAAIQRYVYVVYTEAGE